MFFIAFTSSLVTAFYMLDGGQEKVKSSRVGVWKKRIDDAIK